MTMFQPFDFKTIEKAGSEWVCNAHSGTELYYVEDDEMVWFDVFGWIEWEGDRWPVSARYVDDDTCPGRWYAVAAEIITPDGPIFSFIAD